MIKLDPTFSYREQKLVDLLKRQGNGLSGLTPCDLEDHFFRPEFMGVWYTHTHLPARKSVFTLSVFSTYRDGTVAGLAQDNLGIGNFKGKIEVVKGKVLKIKIEKGYLPVFKTEFAQSIVRYITLNGEERTPEELRVLQTPGATDHILYRQLITVNPTGVGPAPRPVGHLEVDVNKNRDSTAVQTFLEELYRKNLTKI